MELIDQCLRQAALYPRWLVVTSAVLTSVAALWIVAKLLDWALTLLLALTIFAVVVGVLVWFFA